MSVTGTAEPVLCGNRIPNITLRNLTGPIDPNFGGILLFIDFTTEAGTPVGGPTTVAVGQPGTSVLQVAGSNFNLISHPLPAGEYIANITLPDKTCLLYTS